MILLHLATNASIQIECCSLQVFRQQSLGSNQKTKMLTFYQQTWLQWTNQIQGFNLWVLSRGLLTCLGFRSLFRIWSTCCRLIGSTQFSSIVQDRVRVRLAPDHVTSWRTDDWPIIAGWLGQPTRLFHTRCSSQAISISFTRPKIKNEKLYNLHIAASRILIWIKKNGSKKRHTIFHPLDRPGWKQAFPHFSSQTSEY